MATNRGVKVVDKEITDYYKDINFTEWIGKKVYVGADIVIKRMWIRYNPFILNKQIKYRVTVTYVFILI